jgi:hypothetical protein
VGHMPVSWLHVSDFHFKGGDPYDRNVVLGALVRSVKEFHEQGTGVEKKYLFVIPGNKTSIGTWESD